MRFKLSYLLKNILSNRSQIIFCCEKRTILVKIGKQDFASAFEKSVYVK